MDKKWFKTLNRKHTDSIKWQRAQKECQNTECYTFSIADSDYETAPPIKEALLKRVKHGAFGYAGKGDDYEELIVEWYKKRYDVSISKSSIIPAPSVLNALSIAIDLSSDVGDGIIIQTPVYHVFKPVIEHNHREVIDNPLRIENDKYKMDLKGLEDLFKQGHKVFVLCNPHNPVGRVWTYETLKKLMEVAKKYDVLIISDEIHADIIMPDYHFTSMAEFFNDYDQIIVISAPTKVFNIAGLKIAQVIVENRQLNKSIKDMYIKLHLSTPNLLALTAIKAAYQDGEAWLEAQNRHIYGNYQYMKSFLEAYSFFKVFPLQGTYLSWIQFKHPDISASQFVKDLKAYGIFLSEGEKFGHGEDFLRASLACSKEQLKTGLEEMDKYLKNKDLVK